MEDKADRAIWGRPLRPPISPPSSPAPAASFPVIPSARAIPRMPGIGLFSTEARGNVLGMQDRPYNGSAITTGGASLARLVDAQSLGRRNCLSLEHERATPGTGSAVHINEIRHLHAHRFAVYQCWSPLAALQLMTSRIGGGLVVGSPVNGRLDGDWLRDTVESQHGMHQNPYCQPAGEVRFSAGFEDWSCVHFGKRVHGWRRSDFAASFRCPPTRCHQGQSECCKNETAHYHLRG